MKCPEKVAGHDVGDHGEQHQENRHPENPTVMHSPPARSVIVVMFATMVSIVHPKKKSTLPASAFLEKKKGTGVSEPATASLRSNQRFHDRTAN
jgi:hypothetical protein